jgi:isopenicillin N synthase-like dioxygenase
VTIPTIPTIDLRSDDATTAIGRACESVGFFQIVGHSVDNEIIERAWSEVRDFFDLPLADRMAAARRHADDAYGYVPFEHEALTRSLDADAYSAADLKESFNIGPFTSPAGGCEGEGEMWAFAPSPWPPALPSLRPALIDYLAAVHQLAERLMSLFAVALSLPADHFEPFIDRSPSALRALNYPDLPDRAGGQAAIEHGQLRAGAHTDYGTLTILRQDDAPGGLEVLDPTTERWTPVLPTPDAFVVNLGDLMQRWTNDRWRSTMHRVVLPPAGSGPSRRQSMALFHNANFHARIECLPTCLGPEGSARYEPVIAGPHLMSKFHKAIGRSD